MGLPGYDVAGGVGVHLQCQRRHVLPMILKTEHIMSGSTRLSRFFIEDGIMQVLLWIVV